MSTTNAMVDTYHFNPCIFVLRQAGELENAIKALKWGVDFIVKAHVGRYEFYGQVSAHILICPFLFNIIIQFRTLIEDINLSLPMKKTSDYLTHRVEIYHRHLRYQMIPNHKPKH